MEKETSNQNYIRLAFPECCEIECSSDELTFGEIKEQALDLLNIAKKHRFNTEENKLEVA